MQIGFVEFGKARDPEQPEASDHLVLQQFQHAHDAAFARSGKRPALQAADADEIGAGCDRLDDVGAAAERTIDHDLGAAFNSLDDLRKHVHGAATMIQLTPAMVGYIDPVDAVIKPDLRILRGGDAFEDQRYLELVLDQFHRPPFQALLEI